jgi:hypothetical protein
MEESLDHILLSEVLEILEFDAFIDSLLDVGGKILILEARKRPEAEVHKIEGKHLEKGDLWVSLGMVI